MLDLIKTLCEPRGVTGDEGEIAALIAELAKPMADSVEIDTLGNVLAFKKGKRSDKTLMVDAHMDEVGILVNYITEEGFLKFTGVGVDARVLNGRRFLIGEKRVPAVAGTKPIHLQSAEERTVAPTMEKLYLDIGAKDAAEAKLHVKVGDTGIFDSDFVCFGEGLIKGRALDNRIGCAVLLSGRFGIRVLLWAYLAGNLLQTLLLRQCSRRIFTFRPTLSLRNENVRYLVQLSIPLLLSNLFLQLNGVVDKALCSYLGEGFASNYQYAYTLEQFVTGTITATLSLILLSRYSTYVAEHDTERLTDEFHRSVSGLVLLLAPIALLACIFSADLVRIVYLRGEFDAAAAQYTAQALVGFAVGFPLVAIREMLIRLHFAYQNTKMPMLSNIASVVLNAALSILLARYIGILGIALATSLSAILTIFLLDRSARQYIPKHRFSAFFPLFLRVALACALAALPALALRRWLPAASLAGLLGRFLLSALCAAAVYLAALLAVRCPELKQALQGLRSRLSRR